MDATSPASPADHNNPREPLGSILRRERESQGKSLTDIFNATGISISKLSALENGDRRQLPADVFVRGFLRLYAKELKLEPQNFLDSYANDWGKDSTVSDQARYLGHEKMARSLFPFDHNLLQILAAVLAAVICFFLLKTFFPALYSPVPAKRPPYDDTSTSSEGNQLNPTVIFTENRSDRAEPQDVTAAPQPPAQAEPAAIISTTTEDELQTEAADQQGGHAATATPETPPPANQQPPLTEAPGQEVATLQPPPPARSSALETATPLAPEPTNNRGPYVLQLNFIQQSWVKIALDGQPAAEQVFTPGKEMTWHATDSIDLQIGNAEGVKVLLNDSLLDLEDTGEIVRVQIP